MGFYFSAQVLSVCVLGHMSMPNANYYNLVFWLLEKLGIN